MTAIFTVQDDTGTVANANAYISVAVFRQYHLDRGRDLSATIDAVVQTAIVRATDYIDTRFKLMFPGSRLSIAIPIAALVTLTASSLANGETITIGAKTYTLQTVLTNVDGHVTVGATLAQTLTNLANAINRDNANGIPGTDFAVASVADANVTASATSTTLVLTARVLGAAGNSIAVSDTCANASFGTATLIGGASVIQSTEWPRANSFYDDGAQIVGLPVELQRACAEYAKRATTSELIFDSPPIVDSAGNFQASGQIVELQNTVGPVTQRTRYSEYGPAGGPGTVLVNGAYFFVIPAGDLYMEPLLQSGSNQARIVRS